MIAAQNTGTYRVAVVDPHRRDNSLDHLKVAMRIMRKENYLTAMLNQRDVLDLSMPSMATVRTDVQSTWQIFTDPAGGSGSGSSSRQPTDRASKDIPPINFLPKALEFALHLCILNHMFTSAFTLRQSFLSSPSLLKRRFRFAGLLLLIGTPFLLLFNLSYFFLQNTYTIKNNKATPLGAKLWSSAAHYRFRHYNELQVRVAACAKGGRFGGAKGGWLGGGPLCSHRVCAPLCSHRVCVPFVRTCVWCVVVCGSHMCISPQHYYDTRVRATYPLADAYFDSFQTDVVVVAVSRIVAFASGSVTAVLVLFAAINENILLHVKVGSQNLLWYSLLFGGVYAVAKALTPEERESFHSYHTVNYDSIVEEKLKLLCGTTQYYPSHWHGRAWTEPVRAEIRKMYLLKFEVFLYEMLYVFISPFILIFTLPKRAERICDFLR